jgi:predicted DNA binding protein
MRAMILLALREMLREIAKELGITMSDIEHVLKR